MCPSEDWIEQRRRNHLKVMVLVVIAGVLIVVAMVLEVVALVVIA